MGRELALGGIDVRSTRHADHLGVRRQQDPTLASVGLCVPTGRVNPDEMRSLARIAEDYGSGRIRLTTAQNAIVPDVPVDSVPRLLSEPLLAQFSPSASPFVRGLVSCIGTDFCNLALIDTKGPALALAKTLEGRFGTRGAPLTMHWSEALRGLTFTSGSASGTFAAGSATEAPVLGSASAVLNSGPASATSE